MLLLLSFKYKFLQQVIRQISLISISLLSFLSLPTPTLAQNSQESITVRSDVQEYNDETDVITARGNVYIYYPAEDIQATAAQAQFFNKERRLVLTGNVYILQEGNSIRAETVTYLVDEGRFIAMPQNNQQVESTYILKSSNSQSNGNSDPKIPLNSQPDFSK
ncbi:MAG: ostA-like family protein [Cyanobacteria bacterium J083]|nr:MAG: ostA-like family protein [Cyanobacteria bacterium J083]